MFLNSTIQKIKTLTFFTFPASYKDRNHKKKS